MPTDLEHKPIRPIRLMRAAIALVLGLLTTVGVAWFCARSGERAFGSVFLRRSIGKSVYRGPRGSTSAVRADWSGEADEAWEKALLARMLSGVNQPAEPLQEILEEYVLDSTGCRRTAQGLRLATFRPEEPNSLTNTMLPDPYVIHRVESGWPFRAFWAEQSGEGPALRWANVPFSSSGDAALLVLAAPSSVGIDGWSGPLRHPLPINPVWAPALADTAFYAGVWWCILAAASVVWRRSRRVRKGCSACGYEVGTLPRCPECGTPRSSIGTRTS